MLFLVIMLFREKKLEKQTLIGSMQALPPLLAGKEYAQ
jgi:hypothetical protein